MTVIRSYAFTLDDAALSGGAVIAAAGSGLPRRVTPGVDYGARVLALGPDGYWRFSEAAGDFLDRTANAIPFLPGTSGRGKPGPGLGGDATLCAEFPGATGILSSATVAGHRFTVGQPFSLLLVMRTLRSSSVVTYGATYLTDKLQQWSGAADGWGVGEDAINAGIGIALQSGASTCFVSWRDAAPSYDLVGALLGLDHHVIVITYSGGPTLTSMRCWVDGVEKTSVVSSGINMPAGVIPSSRGKLLCGYTGAAAYDKRTSNVAVWGNRCLTPAEVASLSQGLSCGTARWTLPVDVTQARTLKGWQLPGRLARADLTRLGVRSYYQIGAGSRVEFDPGDDLTVAIPSGSACYLDADLTHHHLDDLPWIGDASGGGPVALYEEADPPAVLVPVAALEPVPVVALATAEPVQAEVIAPEPEAVQLIAGDGT